MRRLLLRLLGGVPVEEYRAEMKAKGWWQDQSLVESSLRLSTEDALHADLARVTEERDAERANANEWLAKYHDAEKRAERWASEEGKTAEANIRADAKLLDAHQRIADLEAKLAEATSPLALAERRYAQAWWAWRTKPLGLGDTGDMAEAREALRAAYAAAAKGEV